MKRCPVCNGPAGTLGKLGNRTHFLCRQCGMQFSSKPRRRRPRPDPTATPRTP